ncbi:MAG: LssY C-terminal domain-containing protein [Bryobacterales bacterium]|nr:LssY C-terminal domain-containing protein [Bryobacterales bacterium]
MWNLRTLALTCLAGCTTTVSAFEPCQLEARLEKPITSETARAGDTVRVRVLTDPVHDGSDACALPADAVITGRVKQARRVGLGFRHERASLEMEFDTLETGGRRHPLEAQLAEVSNARESVDRKGAVRGVLAADTNLNLSNGLWHSLRPNASLFRRAATGLTGLAGMAATGFGEHPVLAGSIIAARVMLVRMAEPEIRLPAGTELVLRLPEAPALTPIAPMVFATGPWADWLAAQAAGTAKKDNAPAGDLINVAVRGSRRDVERAFAAAGWRTTDPLNKKTALRLFQAHSRKGPYATAPVSPLYYEGRLPDAVFQKSFNTVAKRHHIRLWQAAPDGPGGEPVWLGAATHDIGLKFDRKTIANHRIDPEIDGERRKVIRDLADARCLAEAPQLVNRPGVRGGVTDGHEVITDGHVALVRLREAGCARPVAERAPGGMSEFRQRSVFCRLVRRTMLETRHYLLRSNVYYFGYRMVSKLRSPRALHHL